MIPKQYKDSIIHPKNDGFTLIELSIVLVIIGLIVGGVLVGRDLIESATIRAQISQMEKYQTAVNTFRLKYNYLPGDMLAVQAVNSGLSINFNGDGGNGDGVLDNDSIGESNLFWVHLSQANLIGDSIIPGYYNMDVRGADIGRYTPAAKLGGSSYVYVWTGGPDTCHPATTCAGNDRKNYFGLNDYARYCHNSCTSERSYNMKVTTAYSIDSKVDDGLPQSGKVLALYYATSNSGMWPGSSELGAGGHAVGGGPTTAPGAGSATSCYDNGNVAGPMQYSLSQNAGQGANCALSFKLQ